MTKLADLHAKSASATEYATAYLRHVGALIEQLDIDAIERTTALLESAAQKDKAIYCIGNGGSAAVASHFVADLTNGRPDGPTCRAFCLTDSIPSLTALANDKGYDEIFVAQLRGRIGAGDVLVALSVSGNSENIVRAIEHAKQEGVVTTGWTGFDGGRVSSLCDVSLTIPTTNDEYGPVEAIFSHVAHLIAGYLTMQRGGRLALQS
jgi:D-sedoheptulose 7-phosphate isomerase